MRGRELVALHPANEKISLNKRSTYAISMMASREQDDFFEDNEELGGGRVEYRAEIGYFDRAGPDNDPLIRRRVEHGDKRRSGQDPLEHFVTVLDARARELSRYPRVGIDETQIRTMREHARKLPYPGYKNVSAFILGYLASKGGRSVEKDRFDGVMDRVYPHIDDVQAITPEDVLRYARMWTRLAG